MLLCVELSFLGVIVCLLYYKSANIFVLPSHFVLNYASLYKCKEQILFVWQGERVCLCVCLSVCEQADGLWRTQVLLT